MSFFSVESCIKNSLMIGVQRSFRHRLSNNGIGTVPKRNTK